MCDVDDGEVKMGEKSTGYRGQIYVALAEACWTETEGQEQGQDSTKINKKAMNAQGYKRSLSVSFSSVSFACLLTFCRADCSAHSVV